MRDGSKSNAAVGASNGTNSRDKGKKPHEGQTCAECRRSKLKCNRAIPCEQCIKRNCAGICPTGTQPPVKGNQALQARLQRKDDDIAELNQCINALTQELKRYRATSNEVDAGHDLSREPNVQSEIPPLADAIGSLSITDDGTKYHGSTSSSEYLSSLLPSDGQEGNAEKLRDPRHLGLPLDVLQLVYAFPFGLADCPHNIDIFNKFLPRKEEAIRYMDLYYVHAAWMFSPILKGEFREDILDTIYIHSFKGSVNEIHAHKLAIFFSIMAFGCAFTRDAHNQHNAEQERFHALACAAISLEPIFRGVSCSTVQAFFLFVRFLNHTVRTSPEQCWLTFGVCVKVAQNMGLQCDGEKPWNLEYRELQKRRVMFWELYTWDAWISFVMGRPPSMRLEETDCKYPDNDAHPNFPNEAGFHAWKFRYTADCLPLTLKYAFNPKSLSYDDLMKLDNKIRSYPVPSHLDVRGNSPTPTLPWSDHFPTALQQYNAIVIKEINLLYLHRSSCAVALRERPNDPLGHNYGRSVDAAFVSAVNMCQAMRNIIYKYPENLARVWYFWSGIYSSCALLAIIVTSSPTCNLASQAYYQFQLAFDLYKHGSAQCRPPKTLEILVNMKTKAEDAMSSHGGAGRAPDALKVVAGDHGVIRKTTPPTGSHSASPETRMNSKSLRGSQSPPPTTAGSSPVSAKSLHHFSPAAPPSSMPSFDSSAGHEQLAHTVDCTYNLNGYSAYDQQYGSAAYPQVSDQINFVSAPSVLPIASGSNVYDHHAEAQTYPLAGPSTQLQPQQPFYTPPPMAQVPFDPHLQYNPIIHADYSGLHEWQTLYNDMASPHPHQQHRAI